MKKVLVSIMNFAPSNFGGIATGMYPLIKELSLLEDTDIRVLTTTYQTDVQKLSNVNSWTYFEGIPVIYFSVKNVFHLFQYLVEGVRQVRNTDYLLLNSIFFPSTLFFILIGRVFNKSVLIVPHGELLAPALKIKYTKKRIYLFAIKLISHKVKFIVTSKTELLAAKNLFMHLDIIIAPLFLDLRSRQNTEKLNQFLFLGRIARIKRIEKLIVACSLSEHFKSAGYKLIVAGPIEKEYMAYRIMLQEMLTKYGLEGNVEFIGEIKSPRKEVLLAQSKALFVVSDSENFSNVVVESLSQGTPVVASKGTPWEILETVKAGFWIENSADMIARKLDELILIDKACYSNMSKSALTLSYKFTKSNVLPIWLDILSD